jgi:type VI secretion system secreted protein VgrG
MQPPRLIGIKTPLGDGALTVVKLGVTEELGLPYAIEAEVLGANPDLAPKDLLTQEVTVTVTQRGPSDLVRHFHGIVAEFRRIGPGAAGKFAYRLVAVPGLWRLGLRRNCRVFQDKTVKQIVKEVLDDHGLTEPAWNMADQVQPIPYCTQFDETDLHFVSRLLEEHGLTYYFTHTASAHEMGVAYSAQGFPQHAGGDTAAVHGAAALDHLGSWRRINRARSAATRLDDMDIERSKPSEVAQKSRPTRSYPEEPPMWSAGEVYHWPGGMSTRSGLDSAEVMMGAAEAASEEFGAEARDPRYVPGARLFVSVLKEDGSEQKKQYVVTAVRHEAYDHSGLVAGAGGTETYGATLRLVQASRVWMPAPRHPRPAMSGMYSAKVTGPGGEKIHVDKYGRIKVKFRWDRKGKDDDTSSIWVRVMQPAAGSWGGTWFLPRVGDEVMVAFVDGDPDRPIVVGSVYGMDSPPPFDPGANKTQTGYRTRSYKSDSKEDANILRFEDKKGSEEVLLHAQKDLTVAVEHDETRTVQNARTTTIKDSDDTLTLEKGSRSEKISMGDDTLVIEQGSRATTLKMGNEDVKLDMGNEAHKLGMGNFTLTCDLGAVTIEAMQSITMKVGANSVTIDQTGVTIKGILVTAEGTAMTTVKAPMTQVKGDGMVIVQGGLVMIN